MLGTTSRRAVASTRFAAPRAGTRPRQPTTSPTTRSRELYDCGAPAGGDAEVGAARLVLGLRARLRAGDARLRAREALREGLRGPRRREVRLGRGCVARARERPPMRRKGSSRGGRGRGACERPREALPHPSRCNGSRGTRFRARTRLCRARANDLRRASIGGRSRSIAAATEGTRRATAEGGPRCASTERSSANSASRVAATNAREPCTVASAYRGLNQP